MFANQLLYFVSYSTTNHWYVLFKRRTNQHSCGGPNNHCNIVIQYTCGDMMRDGTTTDTIPTDFEQCNDHNCTSDLEYGMHEDIYYYANCRLRSRNKGLFTANQVSNRSMAVTRDYRKVATPEINFVVVCLFFIRRLARLLQWHQA